MIKIRFDTNHKAGNRTQKVYVSSNTEPAVLSLQLTGVVEQLKYFLGFLKNAVKIQNISIK